MAHAEISEDEAKNDIASYYLFNVLEDQKLKVQILGRGFAWLDTGTMDSLMEASTFVQTVQNRQGVVISAPEEIGFLEGWINKEELIESAKLYGKSPYGEHLMSVAEEKFSY